MVVLLNLRLLLFLFLFLLLLSALVSSDAIVIGNLVLFHLGDLFLIYDVDGFGHVIEKSKHFTKVISANHCIVVVDLLISVEQIKDVLHFLKGVTREQPCLFEPRYYPLDLLPSVAATSRLVVLFYKCFLIITLRYLLVL